MTDAELNEAVAVKVMGWAKSGKTVKVWYSDKGIENGADFLASDWSGVRMVVERMRELEFDTEIEDVFATKQDWRCSFYNRKGAMVSCETGTLPRAVMLAAIKALEAKE